MSDVIFEARNLTKKYKNQFALDDVSITLKNNRIYGFIGENGADNGGTDIPHFR